MINSIIPGGRRTIIFSAIILFVISCCGSLASSGSVSSPDSIGRVLIALVIILLAAKLGGDLVTRIGQPAVLGELVFGIIIGNLYLAGFHDFDFIRVDENIRILSEIGVTLLLFQVGLESDLGMMMKVGASSLRVATIGVIAPMALGYGVAAFFLPNESVYAHLFVGATLCATSVGITARVLKDLGKLQLSEARIILGAAVIDDVQGLIVLAVVAGIIRAANTGADMSPWAIVSIVLKATVFLFMAIVIGQKISPRVFHYASKLRSSDLLLTVALAMCFALAYSASVIGLAPIVGAFAAGLILDEVHWIKFSQRGEGSVEDLVKPLVAFLVPVFFVRMGTEVQLSAFANPAVLGFAAALTIAAIIGKQACGIFEKRMDRISIGIGMIPRGEVGLIFAATGAALVLKGQKIITSETFSAVVIMVIVTTMITPPLLKWSMSRYNQSSIDNPS